MEDDLLSAGVQDTPFLQTTERLVRWARVFATATAVACLGMIVVVALEIRGVARLKDISVRSLISIILVAINTVIICLNVFSVFKAFRYANELQLATQLNTGLKDLVTPFKTAIVLQKTGLLAAVSMVMYCIVFLLASFL